MSSVPKARSGRVSHAEAAEILATRDPVLDGLMVAAGPIRIFCMLAPTTRTAC